VQKEFRFQGRVTREIKLRSLLYLPGDYQTERGKRWPLLCFLHGAGERGTNLDLVAKHGPPKLVAQKKEFPFVLLSPQCPSGQVWDDAALLVLLDHVIAKFRIDARRVYLTGLSMGGYGTWSLGLKHPERFAAIAPVCGGGNYADILLANPGQSRAMRSLGVWAFHGAKDTVVPPAESKVMIAALKKAGCRDVALTLYPHIGHDVHTETYNNPKLYEWFLSHRRR
jgi:predicted peptidase